jgi:hypothetical protein
MFLGYNFFIMLKRLAVFSAGVLLCAGIMTGQPNQTPNGEGQDAKQSKPSVVEPNSHDKDNPGEQNQSESRGSAPTGNAALKWPAWMGDANWWLVLIAGITGGCIAWQSWETRTAARGARDAAQASLLNIRAFINAERPWIMARVEPSGRKNAYRVVAVNKGRTPASVLSHAENCVLKETSELPPDIAVYGEPDNRSKIVLPDESIEIMDFSEHSFVRKDEGKLARFRSWDAEGFVCGIIIYRDLLGAPADKTCETRWAFSVIAGGDGDVIPVEYTVGGDEYTRHT